MDDFKTNIINAILICSKKALKINKKQLEQGLNIEKYLQDMQEFSTNKIKLLRDNDNFDEDFFIENIAE
ncbi:MAG: hypothetical protein MZU95_04385 [Desulfomicrobium escambiense]|nr:hypothetical protein [Desulfomicrobium escambiense]